MIILISVLATVLLVFIVFVLFCFVTFRKTFLREKTLVKIEENFYKNLSRHKCAELAETIRENKKNFDGIEYKEVTIFSRDELHLSGKLYFAENSESKKSVILCHGYKSYGEFDFGAAFKMYREMDYNILMIDQRAHGKSEGKYTTMGIMESFDIFNWCKWLEMCFGTGSEIIIHGISMGAFAAVACAANPGLPINVKCVIADSLYPLVYGTVMKNAEKGVSFLAKPTVAFINMFYRNHTGFDMRDYSLFTVAKAVGIPVLFIHSPTDSTASLSDAEAVARRIPAKTHFVKTRKAPHGTCFVKDEKLCTESIKSFIGEL